MINTMIALALADFAFLIPVAVAAVGGFVVYKVTKAVVKKVKISKAKKAAKEAEKEAQRAAEAEAAMSAEAEMSQEVGAETEPRFASRNGFHTTENYERMVGKSGEFAAKQDELLKLQNELETKGKAGDKRGKKLYSKKKALGDVTLQSDYVKRKDNGEYDLTTYIQVGDEDYARAFKAMAKGDNTEGMPLVCTISFNAESGKQDLRLSTPSKAVFKQGERLLLQKVVDELSMISSDDELERHFPIVEKCAYGDLAHERVFDNELDILEAFQGYIHTDDLSIEN